jgi:GNAT superfamily N-acetyltransferase
MYLSPTHRSQGIGDWPSASAGLSAADRNCCIGEIGSPVPAAEVVRKLIGSVINHARERVEQIHLHVVTTNTAAYNLYRSLGFVACGIEPRALRHAGRDYDEAMMVLMIEPL